MFITIDNNIIEKLSRTELAVIRFINENKNRLSKLSIVDIACETFCSPATVSRAIRKCGLNGFNELRYKLALEDKDNITYSTVEVLNKSLIEAQRVIEQISLESLENIKNKLMSSRRIYIIARGLTSHVAEEFMFKLELLDFNAFSIVDPNVMKIKSNNMKKDETLFIFSLNGKTQELITSAKNANLCGANVITCCCNKDSELLSLSDNYIVGYKHNHNSISTYEVASRVSLHIISRIIIDYITMYK